MIVVRLLAVRVQPVFVLVDLETGDVQPAPPVTPADLTAAQIADIGTLLDTARKQIEEQAQT